MGRVTFRDLISKREGSTLAGASQDAEVDQIRQDMSKGFETAIVKDVISNPVDFFNKTYKDDGGLIGEPTLYRDALKNVKSGVGVSNKDMVDFTPRNSIIAFPTAAGSSAGKAVPEIFFPFFPPHLAFPVKPGEAVWIFYEDIGGGQKKGYWLCRKPSYRQVDDVNLTVHSRESKIADLQSSNESSGEELDSKTKEHAELLMSTFPNYGSLKIGPDKLVADSIAYREEFIGEPVPRYSKKCGDFVIQGSNNTLISLGVDKSLTHEVIDSMTGISSDLIEDESYTSVFDTNQNDSLLSSIVKNDRMLKPEMAGCIDLVVGRGALDLQNNTLFNDESLSSAALLGGLSLLTPGSFPDDVSNIVKKFTSDLEGTNSVVANARSKASSLNYYEIEKGSDFSGNDNESPLEGAFETLSDAEARFYVSMRSAPNAKYPNIIQDLIEDEDIENSLNSFFGEGKSAIVGSAYSIKSYARGNCELQSAMGGSMFMSDGVVIASSGGAYIHLKPSGDISIVPGPEGTIKIGGEDASLALLGSDHLGADGAIATGVGPVQLPTSGPGTIAGMPITSTAGGTIGMTAIVEMAAGSLGIPADPPPNGKFATKILMK